MIRGARYPIPVDVMEQRLLRKGEVVTEHREPCPSGRFRGDGIIVIDSNDGRIYPVVLSFDGWRGRMSRADASNSLPSPCRGDECELSVAHSRCGPRVAS